MSVHDGPDGGCDGTCEDCRSGPPVATQEARSVWHLAARCAGWLPPEEMERRITRARDEALEEAARTTDRALNEFFASQGPASVPGVIRRILDGIRTLKGKP